MKWWQILLLAISVVGLMGNLAYWLIRGWLEGPTISDGKPSRFNASATVWHDGE